MPRILKDGWTIYKEWVEYESYEPLFNSDGKVVAVRKTGKRTHWVETDCASCSDVVTMPLSKLVAGGSEQCDACRAYNGRYY